MDIHSILLNLGFVLTDRGSFWQTSAIWRGGDNQTAVQIYKDSGTWKDYVEDTKFLPFQALYKKVTGKELKGDYNFHNPDKPKQQFLMEERIYPDNVLVKLVPQLDFYTRPKGNRGAIRREVLDQFEAGYAMGSTMYQRIVFPIRNEERKLHGFTGRHTIEGKSPKWLKTGESRNWFYPYYNIPEVQEEIEKKREVFIVESVGDCLSMFNAGIKNVLVAFTRSLSATFISRLAFLPCDRFIIAMNNDRDKEENRGQQGAAKTLLELSSFIDLDKLYHAVPTKGDFGEMSVEDYKDFKVSEWKDGIKHLLNYADKTKAAYKRIAAAV